MNESGKWHPDAIERQLAHIENNEVRRPYLRAGHWEERVKMMQWWADYLDKLKGRTKPHHWKADDSGIKVDAAE